MGKKKFNKKKSVRFALVPGVDENGNPANTFKPMETKSKLTSKEKSSIINELVDYDIEINGKQVDESQIPAYILEQIRGRSDLVYNQKHDQQEMQEDIEDEYQIEDEEWEEEEEWVDEEWVEDEGEVKKQQPNLNEKEFPALQTVEFQGQQYSLSKEQMNLLNCVLPENYEEFEIKGVQFTKFNEDGIRLDQKEAYAQFIAEDKKRAVVDSYEFITDKPINVVDNDLKPTQIKGQIKEIEDALDFQGEQGAYEELEDDFFANLLKGNEVKAPKKQKKKEEKIDPQTAFKKKEKKQKKKEIHQQKIQKKNQLDELQLDENDRKMLEMQEMQEEQITDDMLEKALEDFENNIETENKSFSSFSIADIENRQEYMGRDGELDWRTLSKKQKKQYMKTKKIRQFYDELRQREIQEKMKNKVNVSVEELHLKKLVSHIPYSEDHVMQNSIKVDEETPVNFDEQQSDYETQSSQDDIISYKQKTSIIATNLSVIQETGKKKKGKKQQNEEDIKDIKRVKVVPEKRKKNETKEQRKERKQKLKQMKKQKKEQKKEFLEQFQTQKRKQKRKENINNPFHKVSYVKIV